MRWLSVFGASFLLSSCSCGGKSHEGDGDECVDNDGDGFGPGCFGAEDCDDTNPNRWDDCAECETNPTLQGCPCDGSEPTAECYSGAEETRGVGTCRGGSTDCTDGFWGACEGEVVPVDETCDGADENCDGTADEGLGDACGDCGPGCHEDEYPDPNWDPTDENSDGVEENEDGDLVLGSNELRTDFVYVSNHWEGTVSKISSDTGAEVARYPSAIPTAANGARPALEACNWANLGNCPSRVAVALSGDVYVANRAFGNQATVTRISGDLSRCVDADGDGVIRTSSDVDADGRVPLVGGEFLDVNDECVLWTVPVGNPGALARAMAIDADGFVWVGMFNDHTLIKVDPEDGERLATVNLPVECSPYGCALDSEGTIWVACPHTGSRGITSVDPVAETAGAWIALGAGCGNGYGIAVDEADRVWLGGWDGQGVCRYEPAGGAWNRVAVPSGGMPGGIASDGAGTIWACISRDGAGAPIGRLLGIETDGMVVTDDYALGAGLGSHGCAIDALGNVWTANLEGDSVTRVNPADDTFTTFPAGDGPYTYSDFTGFQLRSQVNPTGTYRRTLEGCLDGPTEWLEVSWDATTPPGTSVSVAVRVADTRADLATTPWVEEWTSSPADLALEPGPVPAGRFMEFELRLRSDDEEASPAVHGMAVQWQCIVG